MNASIALATELEKALFGGAWHGPSWKEVISGVTAEGSEQRPISQAHTIGEIVAHASTWFEVVDRRLQGETPDVSDAQDWPATQGLAKGDWELLCDRSLERARALVETVRRFSPERLHEPRPGMKDTWFELITGELQHILYHAGQVGLLKKAGS